MSAMLSRREISSVDLTTQLIAAVEAKNPRFQAFLTPTFELALEQAAAADKRIAAGQRASPIDGIAVALKDAYDTKGIRTTVGSGLFKNRIPMQDAAIWEKLRDAGAVLLDFTNSGPVIGPQVVAAVDIPVIGGFGGGPWLDGRVRLAQAAVGYNVAAIDKEPDSYANVARVIHDALGACASDVRAARQIKGQPGRS